MLLFSTIVFFSDATEYVTINDGNWSDPTIWSTDGGSTNCGCTPSSPTGGDNITINHDVTSTLHLTLTSGSVFTVNSSGTYQGGFNLTVLGGSTAQIYGQSQFSKLVNGQNSGNNGGFINIYNTIVEVTNQIRLNDGTVTVEGFLYMPTGNFNVAPNAVFNTVSGAKLELFGGNITNEGTIDICSTCCLTTLGNWSNELTGTVNGSGSATSTGGNMTNLGTFSPSITWCSNGFDVGMPSPENCSTSTSTCGVVSLPVELVSFEGNNMGDYNLLTWATASEKGCRNFTMTYSTDGYDWVPIGSVNCMGTTTEMTYYEFLDHDNKPSVAYYRLEQTDFDGSISYSKPISITSLNAESIKIYPNPVTSGTAVYFTGTQKGGSLNIYGPTGTLINQTYIEQGSGSTTSIETSSLVQGVYLVEYTNPSTGVLRTKFVVQ